MKITQSRACAKTFSGAKTVRTMTLHRIFDHLRDIAVDDNFLRASSVQHQQSWRPS